MKGRLSLLTLLLLAFTHLALASELPAAEQAQLQYHLQNLYNEVDLLIRNQRADQSDLSRQTKELRSFKVFERIPFSVSEHELERNLRASTQKLPITIERVRITSRSRPDRAVPRTILNDERPFHPSEDQLAEKIRFEARVVGDEDAVWKWIHGWHLREQGLVLDPIEPDAVRKVAPSRAKIRWLVRGQTYSFRKLEPPRIVFHDPDEFLPEEAKLSPKLSDLIARIHQLAPKALPLYQVRGRFFLDGARMSFFLSKVDALP